MNEARAILWGLADPQHFTVARRANFKGGTKIKQPDPVDPMREAEAQIALQRELAAMAEEQRIAQELRDAEQRQIDLTNFNTRLDQLFNSSLDQGTNLIRRQGLDEGRFLPLLREDLQAARQRVPELAADPGAYFDIENILNGITSNALSQDRRNLNLALNEFAAPGFANTMVPGTLDDATLAKILNEQYTDANTQLTRARDRGNLTDFGFQSALANLDSQRSAADARLQSLGGGVLEGIRGDLRDIATQGRSRADAYQFGDTYDPASTQNALQTLFSERSGRLEGDIRGALGGEQLFNVGDILGRASSAQGAQNQTAASPILLSALAQREEDRAKNRGIGTQGVF